MRNNKDVKSSIEFLFGSCVRNYFIFAIKTIGKDIKTLQFGWPIGMPLARKMGNDMWELRSTLSYGIARTFFTVFQNKVVLLHGFVKKSQKTPSNELATAKRRLTRLRT